MKEHYWHCQLSATLDVKKIDNSTTQVLDDYDQTDDWFGTPETIISA